VRESSASRGARVVHIINALPPIGGAERLVVDLAKCSQDRPVPVITWQSTDNSLVELEGGDSVDLIPLRPFTFHALLRARRAIAQADVVHVHLFPTQYFAPLLCKPTVFTEHNTWNRRRRYPWLKPVERLCYRMITKTVAISDETAAALVAWLGREPPRLEIIPNGVRLERFPLVERTPPTERFTIGMAARMTEAKDHATLIAAMERIPDRCTLLLAGDGPLRPDLERQVAKLGLEERVRFLGVVHDMPRYYAEIDVYVQSSWHDGFSLVAVEAMACGLPTLGSNIPGLAQTIGTEEALFTPGDADQLAARLTALISDPVLYSKLARHAVAQARRFDVRETAARYARAYAEIAR
jgi:glycosyltransferase involved in cell wall biosynthesis